MCWRNAQSQALKAIQAPNFWWFGNLDVGHKGIKRDKCQNIGIYRLTMGFHEHYGNVMGFYHGKRTFNQHICWYSDDI